MANDLSEAKKILKKISQCENVEKDITELDSAHLKDLFTGIINLIESDDGIWKIRKTLGPVYALRTITDLGFFQTYSYYKNKSNEENKQFSISGETSNNLEKRMQVIVAELFQWDKRIVLADLAIAEQTSETEVQQQYDQCYAIKGVSEESNKYMEYRRDYLERKGTSTLHHSHLRKMRLDSLSEGGLSEGKKINFDHGDPNYFVSGCTQLTAAKPIRLEADSTFMKDVVIKTLDPGCNDNNGKYYDLHFTASSHTDYLNPNDPKDARVSVHLFLFLKGDSKGETISPDLVGAIENIVYNLTTLASLEKLKERQRELERKEQMLMLLMEPLEQLTSGLARTTESAQRLRAVLWDPDKSIFSAASKVWLYFEQGAEPIVAGVPCKVEHNTDRYLDPKILSLTVLAVFSEIFGKDPKDAKNVSELWAWVRGDLTRNDDAMAQLRYTCQKILYTPKNGQDVKDVKDWIWMHMDSYINSEKKWDNNDSKCNRDKHIETVLERLKLLLHEPYKFAPGNVSVLPIALILFGKTGFSKETAPLKIQQKGFPPYCKQFNDFESVLEEDLPKIFSGHNLPFPRVINLWTFVSRLVDQEASNGNLPNGTSIEICSCVTEIKLTFIKDLFKVDQNLVDRFQSLVGTKSSSSSLIGGDIMLPWLEFALSCEGEACGKAKNEGGCVTIKNENGETFSIETKKDSLFVKAEKQ